MSKSSIRELNGYRLIYDPSHPKSMKNDNWLGYVYEHTVVAEKYLGRSIKESELVHHLDGNRANNRCENLLVLERSQHAKIEEWLANGAPTLKKVGENRVNSGKSKVTQPSYCSCCGKTLQHKQKNHCSFECSGFDKRKVKRPSKKELQKEIEETSFLALGRKYGVSDNAVRKWAKAYGLL